MEWFSAIKGVLGPLFSLVGSLSILRAVLGFALVFWLPGFAWTLVFFRGKALTIVERLALSFGLSIALVTLSILALNMLVGMAINGFNAVLVIVFITFVPLAYYGISRWRQR
ncbi:MAG: DUF1616 domain-containing protein [Chloroflexota bacterium]